MFPAREAADTLTAQLLIHTLDHARQLRGVPDRILRGRRITISLAARMPPGMDAHSDAVQLSIILPLASALAWEPRKLERVMRHELAHIALAMWLDYPELPRWFEEGFAEWAAGGLTCEGETRVRLELIMRRKHNRPRLRLLTLSRFTSTRLSHDFAATFFKYIDESWRGVLRDGRLLDGVKAYGATRGLSYVLGRPLEQLEDGWQSYLSQHYLDGTLRDCRTEQ